MVSRERGRSRVSRLDDITLIRSGDFIYAASSRRFQARTVREEADGKPPITQILHLCQGARFLITLQSDEEARTLAQEENLRDRRLPICLFSDGTRLESPTARCINEIT